MQNIRNRLKDLWHREGITVVVIIGMSLMLLTLMFDPDRPSSLHDQRQEFYRSIGIEGVARIAANKRDMPALQIGDLVRFTSGKMVIVRRIARGDDGMPIVIGAETPAHREFTFDARSERCLSQITAIISQTDRWHEVLLSAFEGRMSE